MSRYYCCSEFAFLFLFYLVYLFRGNFYSGLRGRFRFIRLVSKGGLLEERWIFRISDKFDLVEEFDFRENCKVGDLGGLLESS